MKELRKAKDLKVSKIPNKMHFQMQLSTRMQIIENKKRYKRCRDKRINEND